MIETSHHDPATALQVPFHRPAIGDLEVEEVSRTLRSGWLTSGPQTERFEHEFRERFDVPHALAVNSCTAGLHLALAALNIGPGMEVITTPLTFCATVNTILHVGATPVLADIDANGNLDPDSIARRITRSTRAIIPVHYAGHPCEMDAIWDVAHRNGLYVVEDAAHAIGASYHGWPIGAGNPQTGDCSQATAFSFYATKNITTGEGGMVTTHDAELAEKMRILCLHGISADAWNRYSDRGHWYYEVSVPGFKYNLSDIQSALGRVQLQRLEELQTARRRVAQLYLDLLADVEEVELPETAPGCEHAWHLFPIRLRLDKLTIDRDEFIRRMTAKGVGLSVHFIPIPLHPFFTHWAHLPENQCPRALALYERLVSLPIYPSLQGDQVEYVTACIKDVVRCSRRNVLNFASSSDTRLATS